MVLAQWSEKYLQFLSNYTLKGDASGKLYVLCSVLQFREFHDCLFIQGAYYLATSWICMSLQQTASSGKCWPLLSLGVLSPFPSRVSLPSSQASIWYFCHSTQHLPFQSFSFFPAHLKINWLFLESQTEHEASLSLVLSWLFPWHTLSLGLEALPYFLLPSNWLISTLLNNQKLWKTIFT